jgi:hypothetical protein
LGLEGKTIEVILGLGGLVFLRSSKGLVGWGNGMARALNGDVADVCVKMLRVVGAVQHWLVRRTQFFAHHGRPIYLSMEERVLFNLLRVS